MLFLRLAADDRHDEERARAYRQELGQLRWLVSWYRQDDGSWLARLSGPELPETIEAIGPTRCRAVKQAAAVAARALDRKTIGRAKK